MDKDFLEIYDKMLKEQFKKNAPKQLIKKEISKQQIVSEQKIVSESPTEEEPLAKFLLNLQTQLRKKIEEKNEIESELENLENDEESEVKENKHKSQDISSNYIQELIKIDKSSKEKKLLKENEDLSNQIQNLQTQVTRLNIEAGTWGGGDIGGGGQIQATGGGGDCCPTDRLTAGSELLILNTDGTLSFPNNAISTPTGSIDISGDLNVTGSILQNGVDIEALSTKTTVFSNSANWQSNYTTVYSNSAYWQAGGGSGSDSLVRSLTSNWQNTYTTVSSTSANWQNVYSTVYSTSASWGGGGTYSAATSASEFIARVFNADSVNLNRGDVVYTFGANGDVMSVKKASNTSDTTSSKTLGFVNQTIIPGEIGYVTLGGSIDKLNLGSYNEGDVLWLGSTAGTFTNVKPTQPNHGVYLGVVQRANGGNGIAYVKIQNGYELDEIHDVLITSVSAGQILRRNNTNNLWINTNDSFKWDSVYTTVSANSSNWISLSNVTNYLSSNNVLIYNATVTNNISAGGTVYANSFVSSISGYVTNTYTTTIGDNSNTSYTINHNLNTDNIVVNVVDTTTNIQSYPEVQITNKNTITVVFDTAPTLNKYKVLIIGTIPSYQCVSVGKPAFNLNTVTVSGITIQNSSFTHNLYNDDLANGQITVQLLLPSEHIGVTNHKKIGSTANVVLSSSSSAKIDGNTSFTLTNKNESVGLYTDGTNYFIQ